MIYARILDLESHPPFGIGCLCLTAEYLILYKTTRFKFFKKKCQDQDLLDGDSCKNGHH